MHTIAVPRLNYVKTRVTYVYLSRDVRKLYFSSLINVHAQLSSDVRYLILGLNLCVDFYKLSLVAYAMSTIMCWLI